MNFYYCRLDELTEFEDEGLISQMNFYYCRYDLRPSEIAKD